MLACPAGTYGQETTRNCHPCTPCATCNGNNGGSYYCLSCVAGKFLYDYVCYSACPSGLIGYQGICIANCPSTTYPDATSLSCLSCIANCLECTTAGACVICSSGAYLLSGICYTTCPLSYFGSNQTQLCLTCHGSCATCNGPFSDNCLTCATGVLIAGVCYTTCPTNTYSSACILCDSSCLSCSGGGPNQCLTCSSPLFYHLNYSSCLATCSVGELSNNYNFTCTRCASQMVAHFETCRPCSPTCLQCFGISFLECSSCLAGTSLVKSTCVVGSESGIIYMPSKDNSGGVREVFMVFFFVQVALSLSLELIFQYKTNLMATIELLQMLSYTRFLSIELTQSTQRLASFLYYTNFAALLSPRVSGASAELPAKFAVAGKTGIYLVDSIGVQIVMGVCCVVFLGTKYLSNRSELFKKVYQKINPYLVSYAFRLTLLDFSLNTVLYIYCFDASSPTGVASLVLLILDLTLLLLALCWRIKTE